MGALSAGEREGVSGKAATPLAVAGRAFERMDLAPVPQTIASTPQRLAVGVNSPGLGWVEVHAHNTQGLVSAVLTTGSVETHNTVSAQLPWIREYLSEEHIHVGNLTSEVFSPSSGSGEGSSQNERHSRGNRLPNTDGQRSQSLRSPVEGEAEALSYINVRV